MMYDLIIRQGELVTPTGSYRADIGINGEKISTIKDKIEETGKKEIKARGFLVLPGIIDVHTHMEHDGGTHLTVDDFASGSKAAAAGGITTFIDFAQQQNGNSALKTYVERKKAAAEKAYIDFSLHCALMDVDEKIIEEIPRVIEEASPTFKLFMTYRKQGFMVEDDVLLSVMEEVAKHGGLVGVHAENDFIIEHLQAKFASEGKKSPIYHAFSRPNIAEEEAVKRAILFARYTDCSLYIFHLTTKEALAAVREAQQEGIKVLAETNPHYLLLTEELYRQKDGQNYIMSPPLRTAADNAVLWQGIKNDIIKVVSTDHCPFNLEQKKEGKEDFRNVSPGIPGIELLLPLMYSEGVKKGRISKEKLVEILSYNPAQIMGLLSKGNITVGLDADLVIFDPEQEWTVDATKLYMKSDYSPYDNLKINGIPKTTILRGNIIYDQGQIIGKKGQGKFIKRARRCNDG